MEGFFSVAESAHVTITNSSVQSNIAHIGGGGLHAADNACISLGEGSLLSHNTAALGGGLQAQDNATVTVLDPGSVHGNMASNGSARDVYVADAYPYGAKVTGPNPRSSVQSSIARDDCRRLWPWTVLVWALLLAGF